MPGENTHNLVAKPQEDKNSHIKLIRRDFDEAIAIMGMFEIKLPDAQQQVKATRDKIQHELDKLIEASGENASVIKKNASYIKSMVQRGFATNKELYILDLVDAIEKLRDKVANDASKNPSYAEEAGRVANSTKNLTTVLTKRSATRVEILKAIEEFEQIATPITKTHAALAILVGAVITAAIVFLALVLPCLLLGGVTLASLFAPGKAFVYMTIGSLWGGFTGSFLMTAGNSEARNVVQRALDFAPKPPHQPSKPSLFGSFFQKNGSSQGQKASAAVVPHGSRPSLRIVDSM
jgi:hypothetical protein